MLVGARLRTAPLPRLPRAPVDIESESLYDKYRVYIPVERKLVKIGRSLAVTIPSEVVKEYGLKKGLGVELTVHPATGAVTIRPGVKFFEGGKTSKRFRKVADDIRGKYDRAFKKLAE